MPLSIQDAGLANDANLQGYWKLDGNANDSSSNGYNLTGTAPSYINALFSQGGDFESTSSNHLSIASASSANLNITGSKTVSLWYKAETAIASSRLVGKDDGGTNGYFIFLISPTKNPSFVARGLTTNVQVSSSSTVADGVWEHICAVYDSANTKLKIFHNGVKAEVTASGTNSVGTSAFSIGSRGGTADFSDGVIDDVAVFNRALTDAEVRAIYTAGSTKILMI